MRPADKRGGATLTATSTTAPSASPTASPTDTTAMSASPTTSPTVNRRLHRVHRLQRRKLHHQRHTHRITNSTTRIANNYQQQHYPRCQQQINNRSIHNPNHIITVSSRTSPTVVPAATPSTSPHSAICRIVKISTPTPNGNANGATSASLLA
eukprot:m.146288 g.146288  ORF g.146288 m.146288 type:complete len:153 (-) comp14136_c1_seq1:955-1413(-)